jgi:hypothetical protein
MKKLAIVVLSVLTLNSCSSNEDSKSIQISYDDVAGYIEHPSIITTKKAHSGNTCIQVSPEQMYGLNYKRMISSVSPNKINKIKISGWYQLQSNTSNMSLVCSIDEADKTVFWEAISSKTLTRKIGEWMLMEAEYDISKVSNEKNVINFYALNVGDKGVSLFDDLTISLEQ